MTRTMAAYMMWLSVLYPSSKEPVLGTFCNSNTYVVSRSKLVQPGNYPKTEFFRLIWLSLRHSFRRDRDPMECSSDAHTTFIFTVSITHHNKPLITKQHYAQCPTLFDSPQLLQLVTLIPASRLPISITFTTKKTTTNDFAKRRGFEPWDRKRGDNSSAVNSRNQVAARNKIACKVWESRVEQRFSDKDWRKRHRQRNVFSYKLLRIFALQCTPIVNKLESFLTIRNRLL